MIVTEGLTHEFNESLNWHGPGLITMRSTFHFLEQLLSSMQRDQQQGSKVTSALSDIPT